MTLCKPGCARDRFHDGECSDVRDISASDKLGTIIDLKHRFAYRMAAMLRELEWINETGYEGITICRICGAEPSEDHKADCRLVALLREWDESGRGLREA